MCYLQPRLPEQTSHHVDGVLGNIGTFFNEKVGERKEKTQCFGNDKKPVTQSVQGID